MASASVAATARCMYSSRLPARSPSIGIEAISSGLPPPGEHERREHHCRNERGAGVSAALKRPVRLAT
jgi:hypothetical protein